MPIHLHGPERIKEHKYVNEFKWYIAENYETTANGEIRIKELRDDKEDDPEEFLEEKRHYKEHRPLENAELFRSFIRTADSEELFDERVKEWVDNHGLLQSGYLERITKRG